MHILLVSPQGKKVMLLSDAGGATPITNATRILNLDATAEPPNPIPSNWETSCLASNYSPDETLPDPAPAGPYPTDPGILAGDNPIGEWKLYIHDDATIGSGTLSRSWSVIFY